MYQPIGVFDSGVGGLTVAKAINDAFPNHPMIYFGDTAHFPYGNKSIDSIRYYAIRISKFLIDRGCTTIVIACNTASAAAYNTLKDFFEEEGIAFVNVVDPLARFIAATNYRKIGIIATEVTIESGVYQRKIKELNENIEVISLATPLLAPMIEEGFIKNEISKAVIQGYLGDPIFKDIEALLLACTHYPLIKDEVSKYFGNSVKVLDSTDVVIQEINKVLDTKMTSNLSLHRNEENAFFVSNKTSTFEETTKLFYQEKIELKEISLWK